MFKIFGSLFLLLLILGAIAYASGWVQIENRSGSTTIEMKTGEMKDAANDAIGKGKDLIDQAGEKIQQLGDDK